MKRVLIIFFMLVTSLICYAEEFTLTAGISVEEIPKALFGSWRVTAQLDDTNSRGTFKPTGVDMWNLSRIGNKVTLSNPFTGANADISIQTIEGNLIVFSKKAPYDNKILTDSVTIRLNGNNFTGINDLTLESFSPVDNHLIKSERAKYIIKGEKIAGENILK